MIDSSFMQDLGFMYISEQVNPDAYKIQNINVIDKHNLFYLEFDAILQTFSVLNRNKRQYIGDNIDEQIKSDPKILAYLADNSWFGEMGHPTQDFKELSLTAERIVKIDQANTSHKILNPVVANNKLNAKIQTDASTEAGMIMAKKILQKMIPGFSCRALARLGMLNNIATVLVRKLITYDWVFYQSHVGAQGSSNIDLIEKKITPSKLITESTDTCIMIEDLLKYTANKDINTRIIMESFELDIQSMQGFDKNAKHAILRDDNNMIYCNLDPKVSKEVRSYLSGL